MSFISGRNFREISFQQSRRDFFFFYSFWLFTKAQRSQQNCFLTALKGAPVLKTVNSATRGSKLIVKII